MKNFKAYLNEDAPTMSVAAGGVDMNPTGKPKWKKVDKRCKDHPEKMYRRATGTQRK